MCGSGVDSSSSSNDERGLRGEEEDPGKALFFACATCVLCSWLQRERPSLKARSQEKSGRKRGEEDLHHHSETTASSSSGTPNFVHLTVTSRLKNA